MAPIIICRGSGITLSIRIPKPFSASMQKRIGVLAMVCMRLMKLACATGPPWNMQIPPILYLRTASSTSAMKRIGLLVFGSNEDPRITISCAIFSSGLRVLKTLSTQAFAERRELFWAVAKHPANEQARTIIVLRF